MATDIEELSDSTFRVTFDETENIETTLTASGDEVDSWISNILRLSNRFVVGIDVEWRPSFSRYQNPVALLQLCVGHHCLIFQLLHADYIPGSLEQFLSDPSFTFVGVGINGDVERLAEERDLSVCNAVDLRELAAERMGRNEMRQKGLSALAMEVMGVQVSKPRRVRMGRWDQFYLTMDQIKYACIDAFLSFEIGRRLYDGDF
ncbi:Werner Syndrome-like exonuclease [Dendrobium catenatum]|uniref:Werner Syndrome-like exonuclease n=1 Tax=Dendrobium catenatum TaxID=906689 RepID=A0A2I0WSX7_9ASPA|nr:Werner Syndrome-like exonuclease [Dendrobium catenatum]PKU78769.1 Werner Syndrome-like exonuclease [Dendrobium catenatum]